MDRENRTKQREKSESFLSFSFVLWLMKVTYIFVTLFLALMLFVIDRSGGIATAFASLGKITLFYGVAAVVIHLMKWFGDKTNNYEHGTN